MSLLLNFNNMCLIDHKDYIEKLYNLVKTTETESKGLYFKHCLFSITKVATKRKRSQDSPGYLSETFKIKELYRKFLESVPEETKSKLSTYNICDTGTVRDKSKALFESTVFDHSGMCGGNSSEVPLECNIKDEMFLFPQNSRFYIGDVREQCLKLQGTKYNMLIADPPWWNKYIRRLKAANEKLSYSMMYNEDIASIPVKNLLSPNSIVAVWCTNAPSNISAVKDLIFPAWGIEYVATWYWLKVTTSLQPLCDFGTGSQKQPYERIILGKLGDVDEVPDNRLVVSIPSALHSHKPPLINLLSPYLNEKPAILELFARYLLPNTTSVGYEPLKWQHLSLYESIE